MTEELRAVLEQEFESDPGQVNTEADLAKFLYIYKKMQKEIDNIEVLKKAEMATIEAYHNDRIEAKKRAQEWISSKMEAYVKVADNTFSFSNGRVGLRRTPTVTWHLDDKDLVTFAQQSNIPNGVVEKTTFKPNKRIIKEWALGENGDGESSAFTIDKSPKFYINLKKEESKES